MSTGRQQRLPRCLWTGFDVEVTAGAGSTPSKDVEACLGPNGNGRTLLVHNQTGVPITISGPGIIWFSPVQPNATVDIPLTVWHDGARFTFRPNVVVGVMMVLQDQIKDARVPKGLQGLRCSAQGFENCLADHAPELLPEKTVRIGDLTVPVQQIAKLLTTLWEHRELARAFVGHITGEEGGALTLRQTP